MRSLLCALCILAASAAAGAAQLTATGAIMLDAGHEPEEQFTHPQAAAEKEYCLKIAAALHQIIERENGQKTAVTILSAVDKEPRQREKAVAANQSGAVLFLSLHAAKGRSGAAVFLPEPGDAPARSWRGVARRYASKNRSLGEKLKAALQPLYPASKVVAAPAPLYLFHGIDMPAAAIEVPMVESAPQEQFARIAQAIYDALLEWEKGQ